ncbi:hypothetical protein [Arcicella aurantiaca]|uniref:hypothetical protein n=1 Tax=Arcicella aurantiaca TaxID=591202 RepID=UPI000D6AD151|nr:hypothetical protein [Arcicella aurantiaca]
MEIKGNKVNITCATSGVSIGYKKHSFDKSWNVYVNPFGISQGDSLIVQAFRIGFEKSDIVKIKN